MWQTKIFKLPKKNILVNSVIVTPYEQAHIKACVWERKNRNKYEIEPLYVNNAIGFRYRPLQTA